MIPLGERRIGAIVVALRRPSPVSFPIATIVWYRVHRLGGSGFEADVIQPLVYGPGAACESESSPSVSVLACPRARDPRGR